jgi:putative ATPase
MQESSCSPAFARLKVITFMSSLDLFSSIPLESLPGTPLPERMRPKTLADFVGQKKVLDQLSHYLKSGFVPNLIFWGPPGTGKTSAAEALGRAVGARLVSVNATSSGSKELRQIGEEAKQKRLEHHARTLLFVDEVHRFNKGQQDVLLPYIEKGDLTLIGATTENPSYELNKAILSRCRLIVFERLTESDSRELVGRAFEKSSLHTATVLTKESVDWLVHWADGDARKLLTAIEEITGYWNSAENKLTAFDIEKLHTVLGNIVIGHDKSSDSHYDLISAMIKSVRGSDPDAALYYMARLLKGGEDVSFIARRLLILASEDVGNADPRALQLAIAGAQTVEMIGLPEAAITLAQMVTYLASAPKSNRSYLALHAAQALVDSTGSQPVPLALRSAKTKEMEKLGYGKDYKYPHSFPRHWVEQKYLPESIELKEPLYRPDDIGFEKQIKEYLAWVRQTTR